MKEPPIIFNNADRRLKYKRALKKAMENVPNPYESEMHAAAREFLKKSRSEDDEK